jgi:hypothetical protein
VLATTRLRRCTAPKPKRGPQLDGTHETTGVRRFCKPAADKSEKGTLTDTIRNPPRGRSNWDQLRLGDSTNEPPKTPPAFASGDSTDSADAEIQARLFHRRVSTRFPDAAVGQHLAFGCIADDGNYFYCKDDLDGRLVRATEWIATRLARQVGIATAECVIIEDMESGRQLFGSKQLPSMADRFAVADYLSRPHPNELGDVGTWPGQYLAMLSAYDLFIDNPDRGHDNFVLARDGLQANLCAIDFGSARLLDCTIDRFPVESEATIFVGRLHQQIHGSHRGSALEMVEKLSRVPAAFVETILGEMPDDWLSETHRGTFNGFWSDGRKEQRLANLRSVLSG